MAVDEPTTTDANLLLGRLSSRGLLDGEMGLDPELSRAVYKPIADQLGFTLEKDRTGDAGYRNCQYGANDPYHFG